MQVCISYSPSPSFSSIYTTQPLIYHGQITTPCCFDQIRWMRRGFLSSFVDQHWTFSLTFTSKAWLTWKCMVQLFRTRGRLATLSPPPSGYAPDLMPCLQQKRYCNGSIPTRGYTSVNSSAKIDPNLFMGLHGLLWRLLQPTWANCLQN